MTLIEHNKIKVKQGIKKIKKEWKRNIPLVDYETEKEKLVWWYVWPLEKEENTLEVVKHPGMAVAVTRSCSCVVYNLPRRNM